jgi:hypothetical protein
MPLPFSRRALQTAPSFSRDFAGLKTLDHGVGPAITFTRASNATFFDATGTLQTAANDTPRFDHSGGSSLGLLIEEARTNSIRNSQAGGSTNGVIGSGGAMPTNWAIGSNLTSNGVSTEVIGTGTESGLSYIDLKISGTPTGTAASVIRAESTTQVVAADGQNWTHSLYAKLTAGDLTNVTLLHSIRGTDASGTTIVGQSTSPAITPNGNALTTQRVSVSRTMSDAAVVRVHGVISVGLTASQAIDLTLRIAAPQLEQGAFATSYIPTTSAAATRAADSAVVTPISSFYNQAEGTLFAEASTFAQDTSRVVFEFGDNTTSNRLNITRNASTATANFTTTVSGVAQAALSKSSIFSAGTTAKVISAYKQDDFAATANGDSVGFDTSGSLPTVSRMAIGSTNTLGAHWCGHIRKIAYWPRRLSNTLLQQLTT